MEKFEKRAGEVGGGGGGKKDKKEEKKLEWIRYYPTNE